MPGEVVAAVGIDGVAATVNSDGTSARLQLAVPRPAGAARGDGLPRAEPASPPSVTPGWLPATVVFLLLVLAALAIADQQGAGHPRAGRRGAHAQDRRPAPLKDLAYRTAVVLEDRRFGSDVRALQKALARFAEEQAAAAATPATPATPAPPVPVVAPSPVAEPPPPPAPAPSPPTAPAPAAAQTSASTPVAA